MSFLTVSRRGYAPLIRVARFPRRKLNCIGFAKVYGEMRIGRCALALVLCIAAAGCGTTNSNTSGPSVTGGGSGNGGFAISPGTATPIIFNVTPAYRPLPYPVRAQCSGPSVQSAASLVTPLGHGISTAALPHRASSQDQLSCPTHCNSWSKQAM